MTNNDIIVKMIKKYSESFIEIIDSYVERDIASDYDLGKRQALSDILEYIESIEELEYIESIEERGDDND